jgi:toxin ParE1/3/4
VKFHPKSKKEMLDSARFYNSRSPGLGSKFLSEVEYALKSIKESPTTWPIIEENFRRKLLRKFPFEIIYVDEPKTIAIFAIAHLSKKPFYWKDRL